MRIVIGFHAGNEDITIVIGGKQQHIHQVFQFMTGEEDPCQRIAGRMLLAMPSDITRNTSEGVIFTGFPLNSRTYGGQQCDVGSSAIGIHIAADGMMQKMAQVGILITFLVTLH